jgi:hypothetical protein
MHHRMFVRLTLLKHLYAELFSWRVGLPFDYR